MSKVMIIYTCLMFLVDMNSQNFQYASRFRNFTVFSETNSVNLIKFQIYQDKLDHKISVVANITKDIHVKSIVVALDRCSFVNSACEDFQKWTFTKKLKDVVYMKNQMWTPIFEHVTPKLDFPNLRKAVYHTPEASLNTAAVVSFYPEILNPNYFWRADANLIDPNGKKALVLKFEFTLHAFSEKSKNRVRGGMKQVK